MGGIEVVVDRLAREMTARGHEVMHVVADATRSDDESLHAAPYQVLRVAASNVLERAAGVPYPLFAPRALWRTLRGLLAGADVVHAHGMLFPNCALALRLARRGGRAARILTEHVGHVPYGNVVLDALETAAVQTVGRMTARAAQTIVTLNPRVEALMRRLAPGVPAVRIDNGVDTIRYRPPEPGERERLRAQLGWDAKPRLLFVGRLVEKKGLSIALDAARLGGGAWELVVCGPGAPIAEAPHVRFAGSLPAERVAELYRAADAFLLPSKGEGFPLTAQEAMASGLAVVLSDDPAYTPILDGAGNGAHLVTPRAEVVAAAVRELLPAAREAGAEAARFARARFSWSRNADAHLALYEQFRR